MAGNQIPDLRNLLKPSGRGRGRGRGRGGPGSSPQDSETKDKIVQGTDLDALGSRISAVNAGYLNDPYIKYFWKDSDPPTRFPIINRGTYVRTAAIDQLVINFITAEPTKAKQIVSLGAGKDTRFFRLATEHRGIPFIYHELDFQANASEKVAILKSTPDLLNVVANHSEGAGDIIIGKDDESFFSPTYNIHSIDLRTIKAENPPSIKNLASSIPTLLVSECCLCYLTVEENADILTSFVSTYIPSPVPVGIAIYEPIRPNDSFGRVMVSNLASRGILLQTLQKFESLEAQKSRLREYHFSKMQNAADINFIWDTWLPQEEKERVGKCEMLDEIEEWIMLAQHYCITWGFREDDSDMSIFSEAWKDLPFQKGD